MVLHIHAVEYVQSCSVILTNQNCRAPPHLQVTFTNQKRPRRLQQSREPRKKFWVRTMASPEPETVLGNLIPNKSSTVVMLEHFGLETTDVLQKKVLHHACYVIVTTSRGNSTNLYHHLKKHQRQLKDECITRKSGDSDAEAHSRNQDSNLGQSLLQQKLCMKRAHRGAV